MYLKLVAFTFFLILITVANTQFINEFHYSNTGSDINEGVEIAAPSGTDFSSWSLEFYNGNGAPYRTLALSGIVPSRKNGWGFLHFPVSPIQNGPDAIALIDTSQSVVEFISYKGVVTATSGPAEGLSSLDVAVLEDSSTPSDFSLQRVGTGNSAADFSWASPKLASFGELNDGQTLSPPPLCPTVFVNEFHYDNMGSDSNEAVEIVGPEETDLSGWKLVLYDGATGKRYRTLRLAGEVEDQGKGWGTLVFPLSPIQNGAGDAIALVDDNESVLQFFSYEGAVLAIDGPAEGQTSKDVGVKECASTPATESVQLVGHGASLCDFKWAGPAKSSFGDFNVGQTFSGDDHIASSPAVSSEAPSQSPEESVSESPSGRPAGILKDVRRVTIPEVQGATHTSPFVNQIINVKGIVTAAASNGYYLQDPVGDRDDLTSDGIFIYTRSKPPVAVGDQVSVTGTVVEWIQDGGGRFPNRLSLTRISSPLSEVLSEGNPLPTPIALGRTGRKIPSEAIDDDLGSFNLEDGVDFFESLEGMRVTVPNGAVISPNTHSGEIWIVADGGADATGMGSRGVLTLRAGDFNPERIQIDDNRRVLSRFSSPKVSVGDSLSDVTGVMNYGNGNYEIVTTEPYTRTSGGLEKEVSKLTKSEESLLIASMNVFNLDPSDGHQFKLIADVVVNRLNSPEIVALQEVQDNDGAEKTGVKDADRTLKRLVDEIEEAGGPSYEFEDNKFIGDDTNGGQPGGNIRCAFIYLSSRVELLSTATVVDAKDQKTNWRNAFFRSRLPLVGNFRHLGSNEEVMVINVHFSSKGGSSPIMGMLQPFEDLQDDPEANGNVDDRIEQANAVKGYLEKNAGKNAIVLGDFNEYQFNEALSLFTPDMVILTNSLAASERYSYIFEGQAQSLDHMIVSRNLRDAEYDIVHCNAEFDPDERASDHDPILGKVKL